MCNVSATMQTPHTRRSRSALYDSTVEYKDHNTRTFLTVKSVMVETTVEKKNLVVTSKHSTTPLRPHIMPFNTAFESFRRERDMAIATGQSEFVFSQNGQLYRRVKDDDAIIKFKRVSKKKKSSKKSSRRRASRR